VKFHKITESFIKIHRRYYEEKRRKKEVQDALKKAAVNKIWNADPLVQTEDEIKKEKEKTKVSWLQKIRSNKHYIFTNHIIKYSVRYGLKYFIFILTWLLRTGTKNQYYNIPIFSLYVIAFLLVFIKESNIIIYRICFWLYNLSLLSLFIIMFIQQLDETQIDHDFDLNATTSLLLIYTFAYLYKHLNKIDRSLANLMFKKYKKDKISISKIENQEQINLKDILEVEDIKQDQMEQKSEQKSVKSQKKQKTNAYQKSNWIVFIIFLCPILMIQLSVYYCLMINSITEKTEYWDIVYFVSLLILVIILNTVRAEDLNKIFKRCFLFLLILFVVEVYYLVITSIKISNSTGTFYDYDNMYTRFFKQKLKLVLIVLSIKTCISFFGIEM
jgi:hypothetical protein